MLHEYLATSERSSAGFLSLSADEHNLAAGSRFKDLFMRAGRLGEWQLLAHDGAQRAIFEPRNESGVDVRLFGGCNVPNSADSKIGDIAKEILILT
jgi:hypothetical protein